MVPTTRRLPPFALPQPGGGSPVADSNPRLRQWVRAVFRGGAVALITVPACLLQALLLALPGRAKVVFARLFWAAICRVMGISVRVLGAPANPGEHRPVVFASNHSSWLDVLTLGSKLGSAFVAKAEVGQWPIVRTIARLGRTEFVSRRITDTGRERDSMRARLNGGDNLILFPEGTSSDGSRVLPFRSPFFSVVEPTEGGKQPLIQPVSVVYDRLDGLPMGRATRPVCAWYGDMDLGSHFWRLMRHGRIRATILLHEPLEPSAYPSRKALSRDVWTRVAAGASLLRQNRPIPGLA